MDRQAIEITGIWVTVSSPWTLGLSLPRCAVRANLRIMRRDGDKSVCSLATFRGLAVKNGDSIHLDLIGVFHDEGLTDESIDRLKQIARTEIRKAIDREKPFDQQCRRYGARGPKVPKLNRNYRPGQG